MRIKHLETTERLPTKKIQMLIEETEISIIKETDPTCTINIALVLNERKLRAEVRETCFLCVLPHVARAKKE